MVAPKHEPNSPQHVDRCLATCVEGAKVSMFCAETFGLCSCRCCKIEAILLQNIGFMYSLAAAKVMGKSDGMDRVSKLIDELAAEFNQRKM